MCTYVFTRRDVRVLHRPGVCRYGLIRGAATPVLLSGHAVAGYLVDRLAACGHHVYLCTWAASPGPAAAGCIETDWSKRFHVALADENRPITKAKAPLPTNPWKQSFRINTGSGYTLILMQQPNPYPLCRCTDGDPCAVVLVRAGAGRVGRMVSGAGVDRLVGVVGRETSWSVGWRVCGRRRRFGCRGCRLPLMIIRSGMYAADGRALDPGLRRAQGSVLSDEREQDLELVHEVIREILGFAIGKVSDDTIQQTPHHVGVVEFHVLRDARLVNVEPHVVRIGLAAGVYDDQRSAGLG
jgi:hypothetical protein